MDIAIGNKKSTGQIGPHFEPVNSCLLKSTGASCEGDEKREGPGMQLRGSVELIRLGGHQGCLQALRLALGVGRCAVCLMPLISKRNGEEPIQRQPPAKDSIGSGGCF